MFMLPSSIKPKPKSKEDKPPSTENKKYDGQWVKNDNSSHHIFYFKVFHFNTKEDLSEFIVGLLLVEHEPGSEHPHIEAQETVSELSILVHIELGICSDMNSIYHIQRSIDSLFRTCFKYHGKQNNSTGSRKIHHKPE